MAHEIQRLNSRGGKFLKFLLVIHHHVLVNSIIYIGNSQKFYSSCSMRRSPWPADEWIFPALNCLIVLKDSSRHMRFRGLIGNCLLVLEDCSGHMRFRGLIGNCLLVLEDCSGHMKLEV